VNVVVGGVGLPRPAGLLGEEVVTVVGLDVPALTRELSAGADVLVVVSPSRARQGEAQALALGCVDLPAARAVTVVHPSAPPSAADLTRWCRSSHRDPGVPDVSVPLSSGAVAPSAARRAVAGYVGPSFGDHVVTAAALIASELVSNALQHVGDGRLELDTDGEELRLAVSDARRHDWPASPPLDGLPDVLADAGRGLSIVASVAAAWGITARADGKSVWCELRE
jgi:serine/threonine-protein kinase RsbW